MNREHDIFDITERRIRAAQRRAFTSASLVLTWERLWPRLWPLAAVLATILGVFLTDVLPFLPGWLHTLALVLAAAAVILSARYAIKGYTPPRPADITARIERDSGYRHRPLSVLDDHIDPSASSTEAQALWAAHRQRTLQQLERLRVSLPAPNLARHDPLGLRAGAFLILVIGLTAGAGDPGDRIARALSPGDPATIGSVQVDVWVTPPEYTGQAPFYLTNTEDAGKVVSDGEAAEAPALIRDVPGGSRIIAQAGIAGDDNVADLQLSLPPVSMPFTALGAGGYRADTVIDADAVGAEAVTRLSIRAGAEELVGWTVRLAPDDAPSIIFTQPPASGSGGRLRVAYSAVDDYGVKRATLVIRNPAFDEDEEGGEPTRINLPIPRNQTVSVQTSTMRDVSAHDWSGLPVKLQLEVEDAVGAIGKSSEFPMILPERIFNHPIARTLAAYRKQLVKPTPEDIGAVIIGLDSVTRNPQMFGDALAVYLGVRVARARLMHDRDGSQIRGIREMLWTMALRLEEGEFAIAGRELRAAHERAMQALREGAFDDAANQLLDQLQQALDRYMEALQEQLSKEGMEGISDLPGMEYFEREDFRQMIEDARELARTGSTEAAEAALAELAQMLQSLQSAMNAGTAGQEQLNAARQMLEDLTDLSREQQALLDRTFREMRRSQGLEGGMPDGDNNLQIERRSGQLGDSTGGGDAGTGQAGRDGQGNLTGNSGQGSQPTPSQAARGLSPQQEALRRRLQELGFALGQMTGEIPGTVRDAGRAMGQATESLARGEPGRAVPPQTDALDLMRQTTENFVELLTQQIRGMPGGSGNNQGQLPRDGTDPFGRLGAGVLGAQMDDGTVKVPDRGDIMRSRRIYDELRRRAGERYRPRFELNYIERLLTPF